MELTTAQVKNRAPACFTPSPTEPLKHQLLVKLAQHRMATTHQLYVLLGPDRSRQSVSERLNDLLGEYLVDFVVLPQSHRTRVSYLTHKGARLTRDWPALRRRQPNPITAATAASLNPLALVDVRATADWPTPTGKRARLAALVSRIPASPVRTDRLRRQATNNRINDLKAMAAHHPLVTEFARGVPLGAAVLEDLDTHGPTANVWGALVRMSQPCNRNTKLLALCVREHLVYRPTPMDPHHLTSHTPMPGGVACRANQTGSQKGIPPADGRPAREQDLDANDPPRRAAVALAGTPRSTTTPAGHGDSRRAKSPQEQATLPLLNIKTCRLLRPGVTRYNPSCARELLFTSGMLTGICVISRPPTAHRRSPYRAHSRFPSGDLGCSTQPASTEREEM